MTLRKPFTLMHDETRVPLPILSGTGPRQPAKIVIQSPNRCKSHASFQADSGARSDDVETSTRATRRHLPSHCTRMACIPGGGRGLNRRSDTGPSLVELLGDVDDLRLLRLRRFDFLADVLRDEAADLAVDAGHDAQQLATEACRRHVDGDVRRPWLGDVDDQ